MFTHSGTVRAYQDLRHREADEIREERQFQLRERRSGFSVRMLSLVGGWLVALGRSLQNRYGRLASLSVSQT